MSPVWDIIICDPKGKLKLELLDEVLIGKQTFVIAGSAERGSSVEYYGEKKQ